MSTVAPPSSVVPTLSVVAEVPEVKRETPLNVSLEIAVSCALEGVEFRIVVCDIRGVLCDVSRQCFQFRHTVENLSSSLETTVLSLKVGLCISQVGAYGISTLDSGSQLHGYSEASCIVSGRGYFQTA